MPIIMVDKEHADDIIHYGVPGMKWGVRRAQLSLERFDAKIKKQTEHRSQIKKESGVLSRKYRGASKNLYVTKAKRDVVKAKIDRDDASLLVAKGQLKFAKAIKKHGSGGYANNTQRDIYGNLRKEELSAIGIKEFTTQTRVERGKRISTMVLSTLGTVAIPVLATEASRRLR